MQSLHLNDVNVYNLTAGRPMPKWLPERKRRRLLQQDTELRRRIELIQDFEMPTASTNICLSGDGQYIFAAGTYKPRIRCFDVDNLSMKFERYLVSDVVSMLSLSDDYAKLVMLTSDRGVELHAKYGYHYKTRIPRHGRGMVYHQPSCDLYVVGASDEIYRLNLDQGTFLKPMTAENASEILCCELSPSHGLLVVGTDKGFVECFDPRTRRQVGCLDVAKSIQGADHMKKTIPTVSSLSVSNNGLLMAAGTSTGQVLMYDIRSSKPLLKKDHMYGLPVKKVIFHEASKQVISADSKVIKIYGQETGENFVSLEMPADINDVCVVPDSGLFFVANESTKIFSYFIPALAPAPKWCAYLDSISEELEEDVQPIVYEDYKFVSREELDSLNLTHLIGTNLLRAYMHGFFMDARLYREAKAVVDPFAYNEYRKEKIEKLLEEGTAKRIKLRKASRQLPRVNKTLAKMMMPDGNSKKKKGRKANSETSNPLNDSRFKAMFEKEEFEVDFESEEYKRLHPSQSADETFKQNLKLSEISSSDDESDEDDENEVKHVGLGIESEESEMEGIGSDDENSDEEDMKTPHWKEKKSNSKKKESKPKFFELKAGESIEPGQLSVSNEERKNKSAEREKSFQSRIRNQKYEKSQEGPFDQNSGRKTITYKNASQSKSQSAPHASDRKKEDRREVKSLKLTKIQPNKYWRGRRIK
eukprot:m.154237 g.154237  ORF g.154237 m.154237 type:complete len:701 (-) comp15080_c0_seq3:2613-4715(-)